jgi:predicted ATPase
MVLSFASRLTRVERVPSLRSASMERVARSSVKKPISVLMASTSRMAAASVKRPKAAAAVAAAARSHTTGLLS